MDFTLVVVKNNVGQTDWGGKQFRRLDCADPANVEVHVYVPAGHPLATAAPNTEIAIISGLGAFAAVKKIKK